MSNEEYDALKDIENEGKKQRQCAYIFPKDIFKYKDGKKTLANSKGARCSLFPYKESEHSFCYQHDKNNKDSESLKKSQSLIKVKKQQREVKIASLLGSHDPPETKLDSEGLTKRIQNKFNAVVGYSYFHLGERVEELLEVNSLIMKNLSTKKNLLILWWVADPEARTPLTIEGVGEILEVRMGILRSWVDSDWFLDRINQENAKMFDLFRPHINRINLLSALGGNYNAISEYNKTAGKKEILRKESLYDALDKEIMDEAREVAGDDREIRQTELEEDLNLEGAEEILQKLDDYGDR